MHGCRAWVLLILEHMQDIRTEALAGGVYRLGFLHFDRAKTLKSCQLGHIQHSQIVPELCRMFCFTV